MSTSNALDVEMRLQDFTDQHLCTLSLDQMKWSMSRKARHQTWAFLISSFLGSTSFDLTTRKLRLREYFFFSGLCGASSIETKTLAMRGERRGPRRATSLAAMRGDRRGVMRGLCLVAIRLEDVVVAVESRGFLLWRAGGVAGSTGSLVLLTRPNVASSVVSYLHWSYRSQCELCLLLTEQQLH